MEKIVTDISPHGEGKIVILVRTDHASALRFSVTYALQPVGYHNTIGAMEITTVRPAENMRTSHASLSPDDGVTEGVAKVLRYFQYVKIHLTHEGAHHLRMQNGRSRKKNNEP